MPRRDLAAPTASLSFLAPEPNPTPVMVFGSTSRCPTRPGHVSHSPGGRSSPQPARSSTAMVTWDNSPPGSSNSTPQPHPGPANLVTNGDQASVRLRTGAAVRRVPATVSEGHLRRARTNVLLRCVGFGCVLQCAGLLPSCPRLLGIDVTSDVGPELLLSPRAVGLDLPDRQGCHRVRLHRLWRMRRIRRPGEHLAGARD